MTPEKIFELFEKTRIIPVLSVDTVDNGLKVCEILAGNGLSIAEITFRTAAAEETIRQVTGSFPEMLVGAGTILNTGDLERAVGAGAKFAVSPGCNPKVLSYAVDNSIPFVPGVSSATDIETAYGIGARVLKFFPAEAAGGLKLLKSLGAPYRHLGIKFIPLGGINIGNMNDYLALDEVIAIGGTWLAKKDLQNSGHWDVIEKNVREALGTLNC